MGRSEEMRVLYVALTRAKENLVMVTSVPNPEKGLAKVAVECGIGERTNPFAVLRMNNFSDLVLMALMRHPAADELRKLSGVDVPIFLPEKDRFKLKVVVSDSESFMTESANEQKIAAKPVFFDEVCERLDYSDPRIFRLVAPGVHELGRTDPGSARHGYAQIHAVFKLRCGARRH